jgi:hypothetical protein
MSTAYTEKVNRKVFRQFPELEGKNPSISSRPDGESLYTYKGSVTLPNGKAMSRVVRVVVSENGRILKLTSSR